MTPFAPWLRASILAAFACLAPLAPVMADPAVANQAVTNQAVTNQAVTNQAVPNQAVPNQAVPNQAVPNQATANQALIDKTRTEVKDVTAALVGNESDFDALVTLRARIDPLRDALEDEVNDLIKKRDNMQARVTELGAETSDSGAPLSDATQKERQDLQKASADAEAEYKQAQITLDSANALWNELSDLRGKSFANHILLRGANPFTPAFWSSLATHGLPKAIKRAQRVYADEMQDDDGTSQTITLVIAIAAGLGIAYFWLARWIARRAAANVGAVAETFSRRTAVRHAFFVLLLRALPLPLMFGIFDLAVVYFDFSSDNVDLLIARTATAVLIISLSRGIMAALLAPMRPELRLVDCSDETATTIYKVTVFGANIFVIGIFLTAFDDVISAPTIVVLATSLLVAVGTILSFARGLLRLRNRPEISDTMIEPALDDLTHGEGVDGRLGLRLGWIRPFLVLVLLFGLAALASGYVTLAGFLMSRLTIVVLVISCAILLSLFIDELFGQILSGTAPTGRTVASAIGVSGGILDLISTSVAGLLRLVVVCVAALFAFGPWGIRFGDINPFNDALLLFSFAYVRISLGTAAFALLSFVLGLVGTRLVVGWLDRRLLPLTSLDPGVRNSMTTILGYVGFAATLIVVLSQLGVDPQKLAVVAGALSVGIGFGLQAITSNFISGLIVLAERPIRVGDIVSVKGEEGRVKKISVRSTLIGGFDRTDIIVPNTDILTSIVRNKSLSDRQFRIKLSMIVDQDADEDKVGRIMLATATHHEHVLDEPAPSLFFIKASETGLEFELRCFIDDLDNSDRVRSDLHFEIMRRFRSEGIRLASSAKVLEAQTPEPPKPAANDPGPAAATG